MHKTFNVSIPRHHIPTDSWEFEYGPAVNDPNFGAGADTEAIRMDVDGTGIAESGEAGAGGRWIHKVTADVLGGSDGNLEFTVIGYVYHPIVGGDCLTSTQQPHHCKPNALSHRFSSEGPILFRTYFRECNRLKFASTHGIAEAAA